MARDVERIRLLIRRCGMTLVAVCAVVATTLAADEARSTETDLPLILLRVGARIEQYFARAQSLICLETVHVQPLSTSLSPDGFGRTIESELQLSWDAANDALATFEARVRRQVLKVNGHPPRHNDPNNCTVPEQNETEKPALALLLPDQQHDYAFSLGRSARIDRRTALVLEFKEIARPKVDVQQVAGNADCVSFDVNGGMRGRIWIDAETFDVLRLDQGLTSLIDIPLPRPLLRRAIRTSVWTMERWDSSTRFKAMTFQNPDETLTLPVNVTTISVTRGSGTPRQRTTTEYTGYKRFLTEGRIVGN